MKCWPSWARRMLQGQGRSNPTDPFRERPEVGAQLREALRGER